MLRLESEREFTVEDIKLGVTHKRYILKATNQIGSPKESTDWKKKKFKQRALGHCNIKRKERGGTNT